MRWLFWGAIVATGYAYFGYPVWLWIRSRWFRLTVRTTPYICDVSIIVVVHNEEAVVERKVKNLLALNYPPDRMEIIVVSDGSTDDTERILGKFADISRVRSIVKSERQGKAAGLNDAIQSATGEIIVLADARQRVEPEAVRLLLENFADPQVGCASGELMLGDPESGESSRGMGLYWRIEKKIREMESASGSVIGVTGALYAARRKLLVKLPTETILDDVYIPMCVLRKGGRVVFEPRALVWDMPDQGREREFARKVRTLSGNYQLLRLCPWLLSKENPARFRLISHKLIRLLVPFALLALLISSLVLTGPIYRLSLILQLMFYGLGAWGLFGPRRGPLGSLADGALTFVLLNTAAIVALGNFLTGRRAVWAR